MDTRLTFIFGELRLNGLALRFKYDPLDLTYDILFTSHLNFYAWLTENKMI